MEHLQKYVEYVAKILESVGVLIIAGGILYVLIRYLIKSASVRIESFNRLRHDLGKVILLGLEVLIAGDIISTVSTAPTMDAVLVLAVIVLIRTFLSFSLQLELEGKWPWQRTGSSDQ